MPRLLDLAWDAGARSTQDVAVAAGGSVNTVAHRAPIAAAILYPSFFCPAVLFPGAGTEAQFLEILLATPGGVPLAPERMVEEINARLVVVPGLRTQRVRRRASMFDDPTGRIEVESTAPDAAGFLSTHKGTFVGRLHPSWNTRLPAGFAAGKVTYWRVRLHADGLAPDRVVHEPSTAAGEDVQDAAIRALFAARTRAGDAFREPFAIAFDATGARPDLPRRDVPLLAHHPVIELPRHVPAIRQALHLSDLHVNTRQGLLARSDARVIEWTNAESLSPMLGDLVHQYDRSVASILGEVDPDHTDAVFVGGDLVDHIRNASLRPGRPAPANAAAVWQQVSISKGNYRTQYQASPDFIAAFSLFRRCYEEKQLPIFGVTGNHDAYVDGYGISPHVFSRKPENLANTGIPADHNLTLFEAILTFGSSYHEYSGYGDVRGKVATAANSTSNFHAPWFDLFHVLLTPWTDFSVQTPRHRIVGLGWGDGEDMLSAVSGDGHGTGHLPRATHALNDGQRGLLSKYLAVDRPTILLSHFTFASFGEQIAELDAAGHAAAGDISQSGELTDYTRFDFGTFALQRSATYRLLLDKPGAVAVVLTGHSHRKGVYRLSKETRGRVRATMIGLDREALDCTLPAVSSDAIIAVLSDSAGPYPRRNVRNELAEWGSDVPGGTLLRFGSTGRLTSVVPRPAAGVPAPRIAVAMEYWHYLKQNGVLGSPFLLVTLDVERPSPGATVRVAMRRRWADRGISIKSLALVARLDRQSAEEASWIRCDLSLGAPATDDTHPMGDLIVARADVSGDEADRLQEWLRVGSMPDRFVSIEFGVDQNLFPADAARYDWQSRWNLEVSACLIETDKKTQTWAVGSPLAGMKPKGMWQSLFGKTDDAGKRPTMDVPDFNHRRKNFKSKYDRPRTSP